MRSLVLNDSTDYSYDIWKFIIVSILPLIHGGILFEETEYIYLFERVR